MLYSEHVSLKGGLKFRDKNGRELLTSEGFSKGFKRIASYFYDLELWIVDVFGWFLIHSIRKIIYFLSGVRMGRGSHIHVGARFFNTRGVEIGRGTIIGERTFLDGRAPLKIGNYVDIASEVMIYNSEHDINSEDFRAVNGEVEVGDY